MANFTKIEVFHENGGSDYYFDCAQCSFQNKSRVYIFSDVQFQEFLRILHLTSIKYKNYGTVSL